jgi:hypothetical protein
MPPIRLSLRTLARFPQAHPYATAGAAAALAYGAYKAGAPTPVTALLSIGAFGAVAHAGMHATGMMTPGDMLRANPAESAGTSRNMVPALFAKLARAGHLPRGSRNFDLGAGRFETGTEFLAGHGVHSSPFDPFNRSASENDRALARLGSYDTATVANVLNVIPDPEERGAAIALARRARRPGGVAYFQVYEGDRSGKTARTRDGWQVNRPTAFYLAEIQARFPLATVRDGIIRAPVP